MIALQGMFPKAGASRFAKDDKPGMDSIQRAVHFLMLISPNKASYDGLVGGGFVVRVRFQFGHVLGGASGIASMILWCILVFFNPYADETSWRPALTTFIALFLPAGLAMVAVLYSYRLLLLVAFGWSVLPSLYLAATPGIFAWFGVTSLGYLFAFLFMKPCRSD